MPFFSHTKELNCSLNINPNENILVPWVHKRNQSNNLMRKLFSKNFVVLEMSTVYIDVIKYSY